MPTKPKKTAVPTELLPATAVDPNERTVDGKPIPLHLQALVPYQLTDQGKAEAAARPGLRACVTVGAEGFEKGLQQMEDEPWMETDPFKEKVNSLEGKHPGKRFKMLSKKLIDKRGTRGWEVLKDAKGDPEAVGGMLVGVMPERTAERRNAKYRAVGNEALESEQEAHQVQQEKIIRDGGRNGIAPLPAGEVIADTQFPNRVAHTGLHTSRGE